MKTGKLSRSVVALALAAALALTACDSDNDDTDNPDSPVTTVVEELTTTTLAS